MVRKVFLSALIALVTFSVFLDDWGSSMIADKYKWLPTECADYNYPMRIIEAKLIFKDKDYASIPNAKDVNNGWGEVGSTYLVGEHLKPIPEKLMILWFSFAEDKFYSGVFDLPYEKMKALFEEGYIHPSDGKKVTYDRIMVGIAPEGEISVWLSGAIVTEVANFQAQPAKVDWVKMSDNPDVSRRDYVRIMLDSVLEGMPASLDKRGVPHSIWRTPQEIAKLGVPHGLWEMYRERYFWEPSIAGLSRPSRIWIKSWNGEKHYFDFPVSEFKRKASVVPSRIKIDWRDPKGRRFGADITFEEQEVFKAFKKFNKHNPNEILKLQIEIGDISPTVGVSLRNSEFVLPLKLIKVDVYSL